MNVMHLVSPDHIILAMAIAGAMTGVIGAAFIIGISRVRKQTVNLLNAIKGGDGYPSLANMQFLFWTAVIIFAFVTIYLVRVFGLVLDPPPEIPRNILTLVGISAVVPPTSAGISGWQENQRKAKAASMAAAGLAPPTSPPEALKDDWRSMLLEGTSPSITRLQMFAWTWISILIYLAVFAGTLYNVTIADDPPLRELTLPDIDFTLVVLMGLSQGAYVGGKISSEV